MATVDEIRRKLLFANYCETRAEATSLLRSLLDSLDAVSAKNLPLAAWLVQAGDFNRLLGQLLEEVGDSSQDEDGRSALVIALHKDAEFDNDARRAEAVRTLLKFGAPDDKPTRDGLTLAVRAVLLGRQGIPCLRLLLQQGVDPLTLTHEAQPRNALSLSLSREGGIGPVSSEIVKWMIDSHIDESMCSAEDYLQSVVLAMGLIGEFRLARLLRLGWLRVRRKDCALLSA